MKRFLALTMGVIMTMTGLGGLVYANDTQTRIDGIVKKIEADYDTDNRTERSNEKLKELYGEIPNEFEADPEYKEIMENFIYGEVYYQGELDDKTRELVTIVSLATNQLESELENHINAALNIGVTPEEIKEAVYQCTPYIGFGKTSEVLEVVNKVFKKKNIKTPLKEQGTITEENRIEEGIKQRAEIFGESTYNNHENAAEGQEHIQYYLSAMCFGDFYTRGTLDIKTREILTLCIISSLGGCESQVKSHVQANLNVGNDKDTLIGAVTQCMPYNGFPRTLNAISCINEITAQNEQNAEK
ncbi:MAG: carboxymuconolactone decarboxylase family protein [Clostridia bacterium]|nr:carboxymuconolactone decarboxylase family protein [Clostridia bacterium]